MSSTFRFHSQVNELVPSNATYTFPTQSTKVNKQVVKLVPKNGSTFTSGQIIRIEFPSDNYLNVLNSVLQFDVSVGRAPVYVTAPLSASQVGNATLSDFTLNSDQIVSFICSQSAGTTALIGAAQAGTAPASLTNAYGSFDGMVLTVHRQGLTYSAVIAHSEVLKKTVTNDYYTIVLYLSTPLPCGQIQGITTGSTATGDVLAFHYPQTWQRGGAQNAIKRLRVIYGSLVLEDLYEYKTLVRIMYECGVPTSYSKSHGQVYEGMYTTGGRDWQVTGRTTGSAQPLNYIDYVNENGFNGAGTNLASNAKVKDVIAAQTQILGKIATSSADLAKLDLVPGLQVSNAGVYAATTPPVYPTGFNYGSRTYTLNLMSGLFTQHKLIPLKWMAAQLVIELTMATPEDCVLSPQSTSATPMTLQYSNVNYIAEMLEFDSTYDTGLYDGLKSAGVPIKFGTFHFHTFNMTGNNQIIQIHERSRSVKAAFAVMRTTLPNSVLYDSDRFFVDSGSTFGTTNGELLYPGCGSIDTFQWRVGGRYYPAQPVRCQFGGAEALMELGKALDNVGDYTRSSQITARGWTEGGQFIMACAFENNGVFPDTIAGINAEEQSDIALAIIADANIPAAYSATTVPNNKKVDVFMYIDSLAIVRDGNIVDLIL